MIRLAVKGRERDQCGVGDNRSGELFSHVKLEARVRRGHPLRAVREIANAALKSLSGDCAALYSGLGRPGPRIRTVHRLLHWAGSDEMDEVTGSAELLDEALHIDFACHLGDEAVLRAVRATSSTARGAAHERKAQESGNCPSRLLGAGRIRVQTHSQPECESGGERHA